MYRDDYDHQLDEMRLREEIDVFLDNLKPDQFGATVNWLATFDETIQTVLDRWTGAMFLGIQPMQHEVSRVRDWMTDFLSKHDVVYAELKELYV